MNNEEKNNMKRREFLKRLGGGAIAASSVAAIGCSGDKGKKRYVAEGIGGDVPTDAMTYRANHNSGDKVSILGYGMMRLPMKRDEQDKEIIDQERVNELVDYALAHGVN